MTARAEDGAEGWTKDVLDLLALIKSNYATDAHRTAGKFPVMTERAKGLLRPLVEGGLLSEEARDLPMKEHGKNVLLGAGWVSLTDAGEAALLLARGGAK